MPVVATGGTVIDVGVYRIHKFTTGANFVVTTGGNVEVLVVAGGGGGGSAGGGGGAGGLLYNASLAVTPQTYAVTVGAGGAGSGGTNESGANGADSVFSSLTAVGGGGGGGRTTDVNLTDAKVGGSGGGALHSGDARSGAAGTSGQGSAGGNNNATNPYPTGGGGGAGAVGGTGTGSTNGVGGAGVSTYSSLLTDASAGVDISGTRWIAGGGGGGGSTSFSTTAAVGGNGGGGAGSNTNSVPGTAGTANSGGGGGGGQYPATGRTNGGNGGSGIVIIRYLNVVVPTVTTSTPAGSIDSNSATGGGDVTSAGNGTISERGIVWGTSANPTTAGNKTSTTGTTGAFGPLNMTGLTANTLYYYRAYAINEAGTSYGADVTFTTQDAVISGTCTLAGSPVLGAIVTLIDSATDTVVATDTSDASGNYAFNGLDVTKTYHVVAEYEDSPDQYNAKSLPFMTPSEV